MKVLLTTDVVGGVWGFTEELVDALVARGHQVALTALGDEPAPAHRAWVARRPWLEFDALPCPLEWQPEPEPGLTRSVDALRQICDRVEPDVIHLNQYFYGAHDLGAPCVVTAHSDSVSWWHVVQREEPPDDPWFRRYRRWVEAGLAGAQVRTAPSAWMAREAERHYEAESVCAIHNARMPGRFLAPAGARPRRVLTAGRLWDEGKGALDLAAAAPALAADDIDVVAAGPVRHPGGGRDFTLPRPCLRWAGILGRPELRVLLSTSAVYAGTSFYEPFGLAPLEAALAGCALLLADIPTFRELWDGSAAFYAPGDSAGLAQAARWLLRDEKQRRALAQSAQARALARYTPDRLARDYELVYQQARRARAGGSMRAQPAPPRHDAASDEARTR
jgi:glycosyltransferase involved in cell wall biosynthesis